MSRQVIEKCEKLTWSAVCVQISGTETENQTRHDLSAQVENRGDRSVGIKFVDSTTTTNNRVLGNDAFKETKAETEAVTIKGIFRTIRSGCLRNTTDVASGFSRMVEYVTYVHSFVF